MLTFTENKRRSTGLAVTTNPRVVLRAAAAFSGFSSTLYGGSAADSTLTLGSTSHSNPTTDYILFKTDAVEQWRIDNPGRFIQTTGSYLGTSGATITRIDQFQTPFVGDVSIDMRLGVGNTYTYSGVGDAYVNYQINSWSKADGNVWSVAVAGTAQAMSDDAKAWGVVGVGHAATASASAHAAEFDINVNNTIGGDFNNAYGVGIGAGSSGSGIAGHAKAYMYWAQVGGDNAVQHGLLLRDSSYSPLESDGWIISTGFNVGLGGTAHLTCAGLANLLNTTFSGNVIQYGSSTFAQAYMSSAGGIGFTGNAALYAITSGGTSRRVLDTDATPSLVRMYGPDGSTIHFQMSDTQVYLDATTLNLRNNSGTQLGTFNATGLAIAPSNTSQTPDALLTLSANTGALPSPVGAGGIHLAGADASTTEILMDNFGSANAIRWRLAGGTNASPSAITADSTIGNMSVRGHNGSAYTTGNQGNFSFLAAETWSGSTNSTYFQIAVVPTTTTGNAVQILHARFVGNSTVPRVGIGNFGTTAPSYTLSLDKNIARTIGMERTTGTVGLGLTISADAAVSGGTNRAGGNLTLASGVSTGTAVSNVQIQAPTASGSGTSDNAVATIATFAAAGITATPSITARSGTAIPAGGTAGAGFMFSSTANYGVFFGSGAPSLSAAKGSLYLRSDGSTTNDRAYINTDGSTTWTAFTTAA